MEEDASAACNGRGSVARYRRISGSSDEDKSLVWRREVVEGDFIARRAEMEQRCILCPLEQEEAESRVGVDRSQ